MPRHLLFAALLLLVSPIARAAAPSPVGTWRTFDDLDGKESGTVVITDRDGMLYGKIARIADLTKANALCTLCTGDRKNEPVLGMEVIRDMKPDGAGWDGGTIIDPKTGKIYKLKMHLEQGGQKLVVRGFIGISLFGRSQTWLRS
jgi:uncharacterized protein (DUF2147 family)